MSAIRRSFGLSAASKYTQFVLMLVSNVAIARLLTPGEIGVYAIAAVLAGIAQIVRDMGIGQYLIREPEIDTGKLRVAFTLMTAMAWTLGMMLVVASGWVAAIYDEPALQNLLQIQALTFAIIPFGAISLTLLKREFRFGATYFVEVCSHLTHVAVAIGLAAAGLGASSLAWASVAGVAATSAGAVVARRGQFAFRPSLRGARAVLSFGVYVTGTQVFGSLNRDIPELLIGKFLGMSSLAFFSKAQLPGRMFAEFVMGALRPVLMPAFSKKQQEGDTERALLHGMACLTALIIPPLILVACLADYVVMLLFGPQWEAAVAPMRIVAIGTAIVSFTAVFPQLLTALGYPKAVFQAQMFLVPARIALVLLAMPYGLVAIAGAWLIAHVLVAAVRIWLVERLAGITLRKMLASSGPGIWLGSPVAVGVGTLPIVLQVEASTAQSAVVLTSSGVLFAMVFLPCLAWLKHPLYRELVGAAQNMWDRRGRTVSK